MTIKPLTKVQRLIEDLNRTGLKYCHWKSNLALADGLVGGTDVDLLVARQDAAQFRAFLSQHDFRPAVDRGSDDYPSVEHYFALDEESGVLAHVHAYYRVITGESLAKNYHFPIEEMLLENTRLEGAIRVPMKAAELVVFTLRMMLKHTQLVELVMLSRDWDHARQEVDWLLEPGALEEAMMLVSKWLPAVSTGLFAKCVAALQMPAPLHRRIWLGYILRSRLSGYARHSIFRAWQIGISKFSKMAFRRLTHSKKGMVPLAGGAVIAFVGPEATGKSTLLNETSKWLGEHLEVERIHAGKPKSSVLTFLPGLLVPVLRKALPGLRSSKVELQYANRAVGEKTKKVYPLIFALRAALLAYDRYTLLTRAFAHAANGNIVLCDRYPSLTNGAADSPQLGQFPVSRDRYPLRYILARVEERLYRQIPPADLVISLTVPVEVAVRRNKNRGKEEPEEYLRNRHANSANLNYENTVIHMINTDQPLDNTILEVKKAIWKVL